jgi:hypothetical protein
MFLLAQNFANRQQSICTSAEFNDRFRSSEVLAAVENLTLCPACWCFQHLESEVYNFKMNHMLSKFL